MPEARRIKVEGRSFTLLPKQEDSVALWCSLWCEHGRVDLGEQLLPIPKAGWGELPTAEGEGELPEGICGADPCVSTGEWLLLHMSCLLIELLEEQAGEVGGWSCCLSTQQQSP